MNAPRSDGAGLRGSPLWRAAIPLGAVAGLGIGGVGQPQSVTTWVVASVYAAAGVAAGIALINQVELRHAPGGPDLDARRWVAQALWALAVVGLLACGSYHVLVHAPRAVTSKDADRLAAARSFASEGEWGPAETVLGGLIEGEKATRDPALRAAALVARARCRLRQGDLAGSLLDTEAALGGEAPPLQALRLRTHLLILRGEFKAALSDAEEAVERSGTWEDYALRGEALVLSGEAQRGLVDFDRALLQAPSAARARLHSGRGRALDAQGKSERALEAFEQALELQPSLVDALIGRGLAKQHLRRPDAEADFQRADSLLDADDPRRAALKAARAPAPPPRQ